MKPRLSLIVAASENGIIGKDGDLPWRLPGDLKRFKLITMGKPCIMGRKTWDSLPRKPLPGRTNIVVSRDPAWGGPGALGAHSFAEALKLAAEDHAPEIMVIGGEAIFAAALPGADRIYFTQVMGNVAGDAKMPALAPGQWQETQSEGPFSENGVVYRFLVLDRLH